MRLSSDTDHITSLVQVNPQVTGQGQWIEFRRASVIDDRIVIQALDADAIVGEQDGDLVALRIAMNHKIADWENLGKPSSLLFEALAEELSCEPSELAMVGDDAEFDVAGALTAGVGYGVLVRTGKFRPGDDTRFEPAPTLVIDSIADLPDRLD